MKSLRQGFGGKAPNVSRSRSAQGKKQSGSEASPDGLFPHSLFHADCGAVRTPISESLRISNHINSRNPARGAGKASG